MPPYQFVDLSNICPILYVSLTTVSIALANATKSRIKKKATSDDGYAVFVRSILNLLLDSRFIVVARGDTLLHVICASLLFGSMELVTTPGFSVDGPFNAMVKSAVSQWRSISFWSGIGISMLHFDAVATIADRM
jgi:hypothetical protein